MVSTWSTAPCGQPAFKNSGVHSQETKAGTGADGRGRLQSPAQSALQPVEGVCWLSSSVGVNYRSEKGYSDLKASSEDRGEFERSALMEECFRGFSNPRCSQLKGSYTCFEFKGQTKRTLSSQIILQSKKYRGKGIAAPRESTQMKGFFGFMFIYQETTFILTTRTSESTHFVLHLFF